MEGGFNFSAMAPPVFDGDNYQMWVIRMETYLEALDLWEAVEEDYEIQSLPENPTVAQIKSQKEKKMKRSKAKACLCCISYGVHKDNVLEVSKSNMGLPQGII